MAKEPTSKQSAAAKGPDPKAEAFRACDAYVTSGDADKLDAAVKAVGALQSAERGDVLARIPQGRRAARVRKPFED